MVTSANEYLKSVLKQEEINLPSGAKFIIRAVSPFDFLGDEDIPISAVYTNNDKVKIDIAKKLGDINLKKVYSKLLIKGVVEPIMSNKPQKECAENEISIEILFLNMNDAHFLATKILEKSFGGNTTPFLFTDSKPSS
jgi:hypothetical protein